MKAAAIVVLLCATAVAQPADPRRRDAGYIGRDIPVLEIDDCRPSTSPTRQAEAGEHFERGKLLRAGRLPWRGARAGQRVLPLAALPAADVDRPGLRAH